MTGFKSGDVVTVKGYEELGPAEILLVDNTELDYPFYIEWSGDKSEYDGLFSAEQLVIYEKVVSDI